MTAGSATTGAGSLTDVLPGAYRLLGGDLDRVVVLLVDGLGYHLLPRAAECSPVLADVLSGRLGHLAELSCTFPSTTPTSIVSLTTGTPPGQHGVLGFTVRIPGTDRVLTHITWRGDPPAAAWQPVPTFFEREAAPSTVVVPEAFRGSGLTDAAYRGARFSGLAPHDSSVERILAELAARPGLVLGYHSALDTAAHGHGIDSPQWRGAANWVGELVQRLVAGLPPRSALLVTADHGGVDVPASARLDLARDARLSRGVRVVAGEPRVRYLHTEPGAASDVLDTWREVLAERADVLSRQEAIGAGLFGPVRAQHAERIGDVVVICRDDWVVLATGHEPAEVAQLVAFHGGRTAVETAIPLITVRA